MARIRRRAGGEQCCASYGNSKKDKAFKTNKGMHSSENKKSSNRPAHSALTAPTAAQRYFLRPGIAARPDTLRAPVPVDLAPRAHRRAAARAARRTQA